MWKTWFAVLALTLAAPGIAAPTSDEQEAALLHFGQALIAKGEPQDAITRYFDPIIKRYTARYASEKQRIYGTRSMPEMLYYASLAAGENRGAIFVSRVWGDAIFLKAYSLIDLARADEARTLFEAAVAMSPMNSRYLSELANLSHSSKDWSGMLDMFKRAAAAAETYTPEAERSFEARRALRGQGYALVELGRFDEAASAYERCLRIDPDDKAAKAELTFIAGQRAKAVPR